MSIGRSRIKDHAWSPPRTVWFLFAWAFLNVLMNLRFPAPEPSLWAPLLPSAEIAACVLCLFAVAQFRPELPAAAYVALTLLFLFFRLFRFGDVIVPMYFCRDFNLYMDSRCLPDLADLLYRSVPKAVFISCAVLALGVFALAAWTVRKAFETIYAYLGLIHRRLLFLIAVGGYASLSLPFHGNGPMSGAVPLAKPFLPRVVQEVAFILKVHDYEGKRMQAVRAAASALPRTPAPFEKLHGADVFIFLIESYGVTVFEDPRKSALISPVLRAFQQSIESKGFYSCSNFLSSPTFGGSSWLAFGTLESGVKTPSQMDYNLLLNSGVKSLATYFNEAGYRTVSVMPGTRYPWPEGSFFGYRQTYYAWDFDYRGPRYGWSPMPDQFVIDFVHRKEVEKRSEPLLVRYVLGSSHAPFNSQPPYIEDWSRIDAGGVFSELDAVTFPVVWPELRNAAEAYCTAIIYDLTVLRAYIETSVKDDALVVILGDHQPNAQLTGGERLWSVPVHVISRNQEFLKPFQEEGYSPGLRPKQPPPHRGMETFLGSFLGAFSPVE